MTFENAQSSTLPVVCTGAIDCPQCNGRHDVRSNGTHNGYRRKNQRLANPAASQEVFEILTLEIKPGRRDEFHKVYVTQSVPLLKKWNFDLVAYGPSLHDANSYYVIRRFKSLEDREKSEDAFYSSNDWKSGPRNAIMGLVDHFAYAVASAETLKKVGAAIESDTHSKQP